jgi:hypothetical protein
MTNIISEYKLYYIAVLILYITNACIAAPFNAQINLFMDDPMVSGKSYMWTPAPLVAWEKIKEEVAGEGAGIAGNAFLKAKLNSMPSYSNKFPENSFHFSFSFTSSEFSEAWSEGNIPDRIYDKIFSHSNGRFSVETKVELSEKFKFPFDPYHIDYTSSSGKRLRVPSFGLQTSKNKKTRDQVSVVFSDKHEDVMEEWGLSLKTENTNTILIVASLKTPPSSLYEGYIYIEDQIKRSTPKLIGMDDVVRIPVLCFNKEQRFSSLEGKYIEGGRLNTPLQIGESRSTIDFSLNEKGVDLKARYKMTVVAGSQPEAFIADSPFIVYMKRKNCDLPYFIAWVDDVGEQGKGGSLK